MITARDIRLLAWAVTEAQSLRGIYELKEDRDQFQEQINEAKKVLKQLRRELKESKA